jgi:hypothetical protein
MTARNYGLLIDIFGSDFALVSHERIVGAQAYAVNSQTLVRIATPIPSGLTVGVDPYTGKTDLGGTSVQLTRAPELFNAQKTSPISPLLAGISSSASTLRVASASVYTIPGYLWIEREAVYATGSTAGVGYDDISINRAQLGTTAAAHLVGFNVYGFNPFLLGRKVELKWVKLDDYADTVRRFVGYIENAEQNAGGVKLSIVSGQQRINDSQAFGGDFASGVLRSDMLYPGGQGALPPGVSTSAEEFVLRLKDKETPFPAHGYRGGAAFPGFLRINNELIRYQFTQHPLFEFEVSSVSGQTLTLTQTVDAQGDGRFVEVGDLLDLEDSAGDLLSGGEGLQVVAKTTPTSRTGTFTITHNGSLTVSAGDVVVGRYQQMIRDPHQIRAFDFSTAQTHEQNAEVSEVRRWQGDALLMLRQVLYSLNGDGTNGPGSGLYDVLPYPWGLGFTSAEVDDASLDALAPFSSDRRYYIDKPIAVAELVERLSIALNCFLVFCEDGLLRATSRGDVYPLTTANHTVGSAQLVRDDLPAMPIDLSLVKNAARIETDYNLDGVAARAFNLIERESVAMHGRLDLKLDDPGLTQSGGVAVVIPLLVSLLKARSRPLARFSCQVLLSPSTVYRPGQIVAFTLPYFANLEGGQGFTGAYFEILRAAPVDQNGVVELELLQKRQAADLGRVCFSAIVASVAGSVLTLEPASTSHFSPTDPDITPANGDGVDDVEWFLEDDPITVWDVSSLGGTINTHDATIAAINTGAREIELSSTPGAWTIAAGDVVRLDRWQDVGAGATAGERQGVYLAAADAATEKLGTSDDPNRWGL